MTNPNLQALIKLASAYDMYDHQHYAYRHNKNNPKNKPINVTKIDNSNEQVHDVVIENNDIKGVPQKPINTKAPKWSKQQTHIFKQRPSVNATGHGPAYGKERNNPFQPF